MVLQFSPSPHPNSGLQLKLLMEQQKLVPRDSRILTELCELWRLARLHGFECQTETEDRIVLLKTLQFKQVIAVQIRVSFPQNYPYGPPIIETKEMTAGKPQKINQVLTQPNAKTQTFLEKWRVNVLASRIVEDLIESKGDRWLAEPPIETVHCPFIIVRNWKGPPKDRTTQITTAETLPPPKLRRREESIETKNLNRHFRSKLRQILRQLLTDPEVGAEAQKLYDYFKPNCVGFRQIRRVLKEEWFGQILKQELRSGNFLARILSSLMGVDSKMLMIKYYPIIEEAIHNPLNFTRWKD